VKETETTDTDMSKHVIPIDADLLPATDDGVFRALLTRNTPESRTILTRLIGVTIGCDVTGVRVIQNELAKETPQDKAIRFDVNCVSVESGEQFELEMQMYPMQERSGSERSHHNLKNRIAYYGFRLCASQRSASMEYDQLARTFQITFCNFIVFKEKQKFFHKFTMQDDDGEQLSDLLYCLLIELPKLEALMTKDISELSSFELWALFLGYAHRREHRAFINSVIEAKEEIAMASAELQVISQDRIERQAFLDREDARRAIASDLQVAVYNATLVVRTETKIDTLRSLYLDGDISIETAKKRLVSDLRYSPEEAEAEVRKWQQD
jgi:predicted transposase/invertase (TIGR01784 family)